MIFVYTSYSKATLHVPRPTRPASAFAYKYLTRLLWLWSILIGDAWNVSVSDTTYIPEIISRNAFIKFEASEQRGERQMSNCMFRDIICIFIDISLNFSPKGPVDDMCLLFRLMAGKRDGGIR